MINNFNITEIEIKTKNIENNELDVLKLSESSNIYYPEDLKDNYCQGIMIQNNSGSIDVSLKSKFQDKFIIKIKTSDIRGLLDNHIPYPIKFSYFKINDILIAKNFYCTYEFPYIYIIQMIK